MTYDPKIHHRRSLRLRGYDYSYPGMYYVTMCTHGKRHLYGEVMEGELRLNACGQMIDRLWKAIPRLFPMVQLDESVVMPNHVHAILGIVGAPLVGAQVRAGTRPAPTVGDIVGAFKSLTTNEYIRGVREFGWDRFEGKIWQRDFYEHIIRDEDELNKIRDYIRTNPQRWDTDPEFT